MKTSHVKENLSNNSCLNPVVVGVFNVYKKASDTVTNYIFA